MTVSICVYSFWGYGFPYFHISVHTFMGRKIGHILIGKGCITDIKTARMTSETTNIPVSELNGPGAFNIVYDQFILVSL